MSTLLQESARISSHLVGEMVDKDFKILRQLGWGSQNFVYQVIDTRTRQLYAMKIENSKNSYIKNNPHLKLEIAVLKRLQCNPHFVRFVHSGVHYGQNFLIMQMVGPNLSDIRRACPQRKLTMSTALRLGQQCLDAIEAIHVATLLHRDIKLINFAVGSTSDDHRNVYLLDFGMVRRFRLKPGDDIRPERKYVIFRGALTYASPNALMNRDQGRRDDLCSWFYCFVELAKGDLPWERNQYRPIRDRKQDNSTLNPQESPSEMKHKLERLANEKLASREELLKDLPEEITKIYDKIFNLRYQDKPDYEEYREIFTNLCSKMLISEKIPYDWEPTGAYNRELAFVSYPLMLMPTADEDERTKFEPIGQGENAKGGGGNYLPAYQCKAESSLRCSEAGDNEEDRTEIQ